MQGINIVGTTSPVFCSVIVLKNLGFPSPLSLTNVIFSFNTNGKQASKLASSYELRSSNF